ncbi:hypothetical protein LEMLEM_LOCUS24724, partial [Lemmus lemmus]
EVVGTRVRHCDVKHKTYNRKVYQALSHHFQGSSQVLLSPFSGKLPSLLCWGGFCFVLFCFVLGMSWGWLPTPVQELEESNPCQGPSMLPLFWIRGDSPQQEARVESLSKGTVHGRKLVWGRSPRGQSTGGSS